MFSNSLRFPLYVSSLYLPQPRRITICLIIDPICLPYSDEGRLLLCMSMWEFVRVMRVPLAEGGSQRQPHKEGTFYILHDVSENMFTVTRAKNLTPFYT